MNKKNSKEFNEVEAGFPLFGDQIMKSNDQNQNVATVFRHPALQICSFPQLYIPQLIFRQNRIIYPSKNQHIIQEALPINLSEQILNIQLFKEKEKHYTSIHNFIKSLLSPVQEHSNYYSLYNYVSGGELVCQTLQGLSKIAYCVITYDFQSAISMIESIQKKSIHQQTILGILKAYSGLTKIIQRSLPLHKCFFKRNKFIFTNGQIEQELKTKVTPFILFQFGINNHPQTKQQMINKFSQLPLDQQKSIILTNLQFLHKFLQPITFSDQTNQYYQLMLLFLKNTSNPLVSNVYLDFLWKCRIISLPNLINFANKLLDKSQKIIFIREMQNFFGRSSNLTDMLFFHEEDNAKQICVIMQNFIDEYGDLQSAAIVANQYNIPKLKRYIQLQNIAYGICESSCVQAKKVEISQLQVKKTAPNLFLDRVNIKEQRVQIVQNNRQKTELTKKISQEQKIYHKYQQKINLQNLKENDKKTMLCTVCYQKPEASDQLYVECLKCMHGGHYSHLNQWFSQNNVCAKVDCCCFCNA